MSLPGRPHHTSAGENFFELLTQASNSCGQKLHTKALLKIQECAWDNEARKRLQKISGFFAEPTIQAVPVESYGCQQQGVNQGIGELQAYDLPILTQA